MICGDQERVVAFLRRVDFLLPDRAVDFRFVDFRLVDFRRFVDFRFVDFRFVDFRPFVDFRLVDFRLVDFRPFVDFGLVDCPSDCLASTSSAAFSRSPAPGISSSA
ncbi:MAG: hypothetical protein M3Q18_12765 [Actinomycetota bacterium]|nr:hypothetical protein [Actinomycetota bacterium]